MTSSNTQVFTDMLIFDGYDFLPDHSSITIQDGRIVQIGGTPPPDATVTSFAGHTLLPGLIDAHTHGLGGNPLTVQQPLRFGVTTVCDMHNEPEHLAKLRSLADSNKALYSDLKCAGVGAIIDGGWPEPVVLSHGRTPQAEKAIAGWPKLKSPDEAEPFVDEQVRQSGANYIKMFHEVGDTLEKELPVPSTGIQKAVVKAAHARNIKAVGHAFSYRGAMALLDSGADGLMHMFMDRPPDDQWLKKCQDSGAFLNPTLSTIASQNRQGQDMQDAFAADEFAQGMLEDTKPRQPLAMADVNRKDIGIIPAVESTKAAYKAGIPLIIGSDSSGQIRGTQYGMGVHMEIWNMRHRVGMTVAEVLSSATGLTADLFGFSDIGRIQLGRKADLVLVQGDIRELLNDPQVLNLPIIKVWREGIIAETYAH